MEFRKAERRDIPLLLENRMEFLSLMTKSGERERFYKKTEDFLNREIDSGNFFAYILIDGDSVISSCMACVYQQIPCLSCPEGKTAVILNVFTKEGYRRRGFAFKLMTMMTEELKRENVHKLLLGYSDDGYPLYKKLGFKELDRQMVMNI